MLKNLTQDSKTRRLGCQKFLIRLKISTRPLYNLIHFFQYLQPVLNALQQACDFQVNENDFEMLEYQSDLREACLEAFTGIIQG